MSVKKTGLLLLLVLLCLGLCGCRSRITGMERAVESEPRETADAAQASPPGDLPEDGAPDEDGTDRAEADAAANGQTKENPDAARKEYDENAPAEIVPGTERTVHGDGEGSGAYADGTEADETADKLNDAAAETATQTVAADQAEQMGVSEDAQEADSALTYFTVLLEERLGALFECQRLNVYWETAEDHVTIFKTSPEHRLILNAGAYDVSARLLEENLRVDDGWIGRKNPGLIVKAVDGGVLGTGVSSPGDAKKVYAALLARDGWAAIDAVRAGRVVLLSEELLEAPHLQLIAMLTIAKTADPALFADVDIEKALEMLAEEATGSIPAGLYYYREQGGI